MDWFLYDRNVSRERVKAFLEVKMSKDKATPLLARKLF